MLQVTFTFYGQQQFQKVQQEIKSFLEQHEIIDAFFIEVAINEAVNNALNHGYNQKSNGKVVIRITVNEKRSIFIRIKHAGAGFPGNKRIEEISQCNVMLLNEGLWEDNGRGLKIMVLAMDEVIYNEKGNDLLLTKCPPTCNNHEKRFYKCLY